ncbi:MAG: hypothetical protein OXQ92_05215 [Boseongicola sp.]|nr:hypothetical protein [Boseongicola sp.]
MVIVDFDEIGPPPPEDDLLIVGPTYQEDGVTLSATTLNNDPTFNQLWAILENSSRYTGSPSLGHRSQFGVASLTIDDGSEFSASSIDVAELQLGGPFPQTPLIFTGTYASGGTVSMSVFLDDVFSMETVPFGDGFTDLSALSWTQEFDFRGLHFDNISLQFSSEPFCNEREVSRRDVRSKPPGCKPPGNPDIIVNPLPPSVALFLGGFGLLGLLARRRRSRTS